MPARDYYHAYAGKLGKSEIVEKHFIGYNGYCSQVKREQITIVRQGKGEGNYALIALDSIPPKYLKQIYEKYPNPEQMARTNPLLELLHVDYKAVQFFTDFRYEDGSPIPTKKVDNITLWSNNASILNAVGELWQRHIKARRKLGKKPTPIPFFKNVAEQLKSEAVCNKMPHNLPTSNRIQKKFEAYVKNGYNSLIKQYKGNTNRIKIDDNMLHLLSCIATLPTRPYNTKVVEIYKEFMIGKIEMFDQYTGEQLMPENYLDAKGNIIEFTESAVWNRLNQPGVQVQVDKRRYGFKDFNDIHRPHRHRHLPEFSFSKISMDDRDLVFKDKTTQKRVKAYYAYDVTSGCRVGSSYSMDKNEELFLDCLRDMFVFCERYGLGTPMEVEVENHLVNKFFGDLEQMFPYLRVCVPSNSQEKRAEHFNRFVKYQIEKNNHPGIGRWWLKSKYNRISVDKIDDKFKEKMKPMDRLIAEDIQDTIEYNNSLHPNQDKYPNMTRLQVLLANVNPNLPKLDKSYLYQFIGYETKTSITRNQYVKVKYGKYQLPDPYVLEKLEANNRNVKAYYMPNEEGEITEVYLYQNGKYLTTCEKLITYNEAQAERTEVDIEAKLKQDKYVAMFDKYAKGEDLTKLEIIHKTTTIDIDSTTAEEMPDVLPEVIQQNNKVDWAKKATEDFLTY